MINRLDITVPAVGRSKPRCASAARRILTASTSSVLAVAMLATTFDALASDWYVRPNGATYGAGNGKTWNDAYAGFGAISWSSVACGDTVWLAGGAYSQGLSISGKSCTSAAPLSIKRAQTSDAVATSAAGWNAGFDKTVAISNANPGILVANGGSIYIDGRVNYGIQVNIKPGGGDGAKAATSGSVDNLRLYHVEIAGPSCAPAQSCSTAAYGINFAPSNYNVTNLLVNSSTVHHISEAFRASNWNNAVIEYSDLHDIANDGIDHEDTMYSYPSKNVTMRYNFIHNVPNDGIFFEYGGGVNFKLYGNVFYNSSFSLLTTKAPGVYGPMYIYNNVFAAPSASSYGWITTNGSTLAAGTEVANNVFYFVSNDFPNSHNNAYNYTTLNGYGWNSKEPGSFTFTGVGGLNNVTGGDAHLLSTSVLRNRGAALTADGFLNKDMDGNTRGTDGLWDIGAFEYPGAAIVLQPPSNVTVQ